MSRPHTYSLHKYRIVYLHNTKIVPFFLTTRSSKSFIHSSFACFIIWVSSLSETEEKLRDTLMVMAARKDMDILPLTLQITTGLKAAMTR